MKQLWHDYMQHTDKELEELRFDQTPEGKYARKEIHRRKMVGYCDGTAIETVDAKAEMETESRVGMVFVNGVAQ